MLDTDLYIKFALEPTNASNIPRKLILTYTLLNIPNQIPIVLRKDTHIATPTPCVLPNCVDFLVTHTISPTNTTLYTISSLQQNLRVHGNVGLLHSTARPQKDSSDFAEGKRQKKL